MGPESPNGDSPVRSSRLLSLNKDPPTASSSAEAWARRAERRPSDYSETLFSASRRHAAYAEDLDPLDDLAARAEVALQLVNGETGLSVVDLLEPA